MGDAVLLDLGAETVALLAELGDAVFQRPDLLAQGVEPLLPALEVPPESYSRFS